MSITRTIKEEWLQVLILIAPFVIMPFVWDQMPDRIPVHWDFNGHANGYSSKGFGLFVLPLINIGLAALLMGLSKVDPKAWMMNVPSITLKPLRLAVTAFMLAIFCVTILSALGAIVNMEMAFGFGLPLLFLIIGNFLPTIKPNYFIGVRTPWTLESPENWRLTHRMAGRLWVITSVVYILLEMVLVGNVPKAVFYVYIGIIIVPPIAYSFYLFQQSKRMTSS